MRVHAFEDWLAIFGGSGPYREAVLAGYCNDHSGPSIQDLATSIGARVVLVFCVDAESYEKMRSSSAAYDTYVIAIVPDLDPSSYSKALANGAHGVVWEDTSVAHLVDVTRAALNHDILMPGEIFRSCTTGRADPQGPNQLDNATKAILVLLAEGSGAKQIAGQLGYNSRTVQRRVTNLCLSLGANSAAHAVHLAHRRGLLD